MIVKLRNKNRGSEVAEYNKSVELSTDELDKIFKEINENKDVEYSERQKIFMETMSQMKLVIH
jgi:hypothetical protein